MRWHPISIDGNPKIVYIRDRPDGVDLSADGLSVFEHIRCRESDDRSLREFMVLLLEAVDDLLLGHCSRRRLYLAMQALRPSLDPALPLHRAIGLMYGDPLDWSTWKVLCRLGVTSGYLRAFAVHAHKPDGVAYSLHSLEPRPQLTFYDQLVFGPSEVFCHTLRSAYDWLRAFEAWIDYGRLSQNRRQLWRQFDLDAFASVYPEFRIEVADWRARTLRNETDPQSMLRLPIPQNEGHIEVRLPTLGITYNLGESCPDFDRLLRQYNATDWEVAMANNEYGLQLGESFLDAGMHLSQRIAGGPYLYAEIAHPDWTIPKQALLVFDLSFRKRSNPLPTRQPFTLGGTCSSDGVLRPC